VVTVGGKFRCRTMKLAFFYLIALKFQIPKNKKPAMKFTAC
jgi:hypothetical protein